MSTQTPQGRHCRIAVLGSRSEFTALAVDALALSGVAPVALVVCAPPISGPISGLVSGVRDPMPVEVRDPVDRVAAAHGVALIRARDPNHRDTIGALERLRLDLLLIACLPAVVGRAARGSARLGTLNLHPSALPRYRGPDPVFWQLRDGVARAGVTVHVATGVADAGPVVVQRRLEVRSGIGARALTADLVRSGVRALVDELPRIELRIREAAPQDTSAVTRQPWPRAEDFRLDTSWTAERAYRFIEGTRAAAATFTITSEEGEIEVERAVGFDASVGSGPAVRKSAAIVAIRFADGTLRAVPARPLQTPMANSSSNPNVDMSRMREG